MAWLCVFLAVVGFSLMSLFSKLGVGRGGNPKALTGVLFAVSLAVAAGLWAIRDPGLNLPGGTLFYGTIGGVGSLVAYLLFMEALARGHFGLSVALLNASFLVQVLFIALVSPGNGLNGQQMIGIALLLAAVFMLTFSAGSSDAKGNPGRWGTWAVLILAAFVLNGTGMICQDCLARLHDPALGAGRGNGPHDTALPYCVIMYAAGLAAILAAYRGKGMLRRVNMFYGSVMGLGSLVGTCCGLAALQLLPDAQRVSVFPIIVSGQLLLVFLGSLALFRERISALSYLGVVAQIAGIAVLKLDWSRFM
jgi:uncharacterized membrane protein